MEKIIITGAGGFVGMNLKPYLEAQAIQTVGISLRTATAAEVIPKTGAAIIHLAGKAHDTTDTSAEQEYFRVNRDLTIHLFEAFLKTDIRDFFYFSSVKAVADSVDGILEEQVIAQPSTPYGKSKLAAEKYLLSQKLPAGRRLFIIRPCMIHGPGNKGNLTLLYKVVSAGLPWPLAAFENRRSFLSVENLCYLIAAMLKRKKVPSGTYHFADDDAVSTNEVITLMSRAGGKNPRLWKVSPRFIKSAARLGDILHLPLNTERLRKLTGSYVVSNHKIKAALNIKALPVATNEGLITTLKSFNQ